MPRRRALTLVDTLVSIASAVTLAVILVACGSGVATKAGPASQADIYQDAQQMHGIYKAMLTFAVDHNGEFPTPGRMARKEVPGRGFVPGRGDTNWQKNTSANLYSLLLAQDYLSPEYLISPIELHPGSEAYTSYDYDQYNPIKGLYWDEGFQCDPSDQAAPLNASYAHTALCGQRVRRNWRDSMESTYPNFSTRGPASATPGDPAHDQSTTLQIIAPLNTWVGNVCFGDGHVEQMTGPTLNSTNGSNGELDHLFLTDDPAGADAWQGIFVAASENTASPVFDP